MDGVALQQATYDSTLIVGGGMWRSVGKNMLRSRSEGSECENSPPPPLLFLSLSLL